MSRISTCHISLAICIVAVVGWISMANATSEQPASDRYPLSLGVRGFVAPKLGIAGFGAGLDAAYSVLPNWALGGQVITYAVDQGADPQYCSRCVRSGNSTFVFAEGRLWHQYVFTPYARCGAGLAMLQGQRFEYDSGYKETDFTIAAEAGIDVHYRWVSFRAFAFHHAIMGGLLDRDPFSGIGVQLGVRL